LLLQRGWRVEYSAASDSFTACPEGFKEFYNQRRRWMPSTIANIADLLSDYRNVIKNNDDISFPYIIYQIMNMVGTILGPGSIFLMLVGAFNVAFKISNFESLLVNTIIVLIFVLVCAFCKSDHQVMVAMVLSLVYAIIMMAVLVGLALQMGEDGLLAPTSLSLIFVAGSFVLAGILHPQEFKCLPMGVIYYITIPSMYLLLMIYSIFNLNNVSWGTREVPKSAADMAAEQESTK
jgi:chitin synthase